MAAGPLPQDLAAQLKYGPQAAASIQRSQYLTDALRQMSDQSQPIRGGLGEVGMKLLATAILSHGLKSANKDALTAVQAQRDAETASTLAGFQLPSMSGGAPPAQSASFMPTPPPAPPQPRDPGMSAPPAQSPQSAPAPAMSDADRLNIARAVYGEARGESAQGQQAVASVILNRAKASGKSPSDVVSAPHQFSGFNPQTQGLTPDQLQQIAANINPVLSGAATDQTNGADHFFNPTLANPSWGQGQGQMIGQHKFMRLDDQGHAPAPGVQMTAGPPSQGPMQVAPNMAAAQGAPPPPQQPQPGAQPFQVAAANLQPGMIPGQPSAPGSSPPGAGTPAAAPPQAAAAAGTPRSLGVAPEQLAVLEHLLRDPRTHDIGMQYALELQKKAAEPTKFEIQNINGVPTWADPYHPGQLQTGAVPQAAMTHVRSAADAGIAAPPGTSFAVDPTGNVKQAYQPQNGQQITSAPGAPYQEAPIQGGTNDPLAPAARFSNEGKLRDDYAKEIQPYVAAREGYQKVISAAGDHTQAGAIAMVFGVMKTLDPTSTVREGEQAQVNNSGTIPQTITNLYNKLLGGTGSLDDTQRAQFANMAQHQFGVYQKTFDAANQRYSGLASSYGMDPRNVVRGFDPIEPYHPPGPQGGVPAAARNAYVGLYQQGKIDTSKPDGHPLHPMIAATPEILQGMDTPANWGKHVITPDGQLAVIE